MSFISFYRSVISSYIEQKLLILLFLIIHPRSQQFIWSTKVHFFIELHIIYYVLCIIYVKWVVPQWNPSEDLMQLINGTWMMRTEFNERHYQQMFSITIIFVLLINFNANIKDRHLICFLWHYFFSKKKKKGKNII